MAALNSQGNLGRAPRQWTIRVAITGVAAAAVGLATSSGVVALAVGLGAACWGVGNAVSEIVAERVRRLTAATSERLRRAEQHGAKGLIDARTHDPFRAARIVLGSENYPAATLPSVEVARRSMESIEADLRRAQRSFSGPPSPGFLGGLAAEPVQPLEPIELLGDPLGMPRWLPAWLRNALAAAGRAIDDVRLLHNAQIEWAVLLFTLWARALLIGLAPALGALTFSAVPLSGSLAAPDAIWIVAALWAAVFALFAPRIATVAMERTRAANRERKLWLAAEFSLASVLAIAFPAWCVVAFAAGWANWWQREWNDPLDKAQFSWWRLAVFVAVVIGSQVTGFVLQDASAGNAALEVVGTLFVIGVISSSYGAMLPVTASVLGQVLLGSVIGPRRAKRAANERIEQSIRDLLAAAEEIEATSSPNDEIAQRDSDAVRTVAQQLRLRQDLGERMLSRLPKGLQALLEDALRAGGGPPPHPSDPYRVDHGVGPAVTVCEPSISPKELRLATVGSRSHARVLRRLVICSALEAQAHGAGQLETLVRLEGDSVVIRMANGLPTRPRSGSGRGRGQRELDLLVKSLPGGELRTRELVDSTFVEGTGAYDVFGVEIAFDRAVVRGLEPKEPA